MPQLMSDSKSSTQSIILHNGTAMLVTHGAQLCKAQCVAVFTGCGWMAANVLPEKLIKLQLTSN